MKRLVHILVLATVFLAVPYQGYAQQPSKEELQKQKAQLQDQIDLAQTILNKTRDSRKATMNKLETLNQKIKTRERLISTMDRELRIIDRDVAAMEARIEELGIEVDTLKAEYARLITLASQQREPSDKILFVLSSGSFSQALKRVQYLSDIASYREDQVAKIQEKQAKIEAEKNALIAKKEQKRAVISQKEQERTALIGDAMEQEATAQKLQGQEREIKKDIATKQRRATALEKEIKRIIAEEMRKARKRAERGKLEREAKDLGLIRGKDFTRNTSLKSLKTLVEKTRKEKGLEERTTTSYGMTPEGRALANNFASNKGMLPWPVERGLITGAFGKHPHPVVSGVIVDNPHIEISTEEGAIARAVFEGEVSSIIPIPGANMMVLVRHGNYFTVYANLSKVYVKAGDKVSLKQPLGEVYTDEDGKTIIQFGLWQNSTIQNPKPWLAG